MSDKPPHSKASEPGWRAAMTSDARDPYALLKWVLAELAKQRKAKGR